MGWLWWLGVALVLGVIEMLTVDLLFLMLAGGATAAAIAGAVGAPFWLQLIIAAVVSAGLLVLVRPWALAKLKSNTPDVRTNVAAHRGRTATLVSDVSDRAGRGNLPGEVWPARTETPAVGLPGGARVARLPTD